LYISDFENQQDEDRFKQQCCEKHRTITSEDGRRPQQKIYRLVLVARRCEVEAVDSHQQVTWIKARLAKVRRC